MDKYDLICVIGHGSNSTVYKSYSKNINNHVAIKEIKLKNKNPLIEMEINIIKKLNCDNILKFIDVIYEKKSLYIVTDLCDYSLSAVMSNIHSEEMILYIFKQLASGFNYLYENKIIHRDIKPDNILIYNYKIKIADFGFAREFLNENALLNTICGTPLYMAPEIIVNNEYGIKSDIWSLGVILYQIIYKKFPYDKIRNINELINIFKNKKKIIYFKTNYSEDLINLLKSMLEINPEDRLSWADFFKNKWINKEINILDFNEIKNHDDIFLDNINNSISKSTTDSCLFESNNEIEKSNKQIKKSVRKEDKENNVKKKDDKKDSLIIEKNSIKIENKKYITIDQSIINESNKGSIPKENIIENYFNVIEKENEKEEETIKNEEQTYFQWSIKIIKKSVGKYFSY